MEIEMVSGFTHYRLYGNTADTRYGLNLDLCPDCQTNVV